MLTNGPYCFHWINPILEKNLSKESYVNSTLATNREAKKVETSTYSNVKIKWNITSNLYGLLIKPELYCIFLVHETILS